MYYTYTVYVYVNVYIYTLLARLEAGASLEQAAPRTYTRTH